MRQPGEPSIEEILESIKQVIAREDRAVAFRDLRSPEPEVADEEDEVLDLGASDIASSPQPGSRPTPLVTDDASRAARGSLDALAGAVAAGPSSRDDAAGGAAEALLRELLRPALAEWLDRNLPAIVEKMVAVEIARIAGRK